MNDLSKILFNIASIHDIDCNQKYSKSLPYSFHLRAVVSQVREYLDYINLSYQHPVVIAAAGHDLIEDARMTYNDVFSFLLKEGLSKPNAILTTNIIYACTEEKGKNRDERHSDKFFKELAENRLAVFVKLCDIKANVLFSMLKGSSMLSKYKKEFPRVKDKLYIQGEYDRIWEDLENLLKLWLTIIITNFMENLVIWK